MNQRHRLFPRLFAVALATTAAGVLGPPPRPAHASVSIAADLTELARVSSLIARVTVQERTSVWEQGRIVTYARVHLDDVVAGAPPAASELYVRTLGGVVDGVGQSVEGEPRLAVGERAVLFLEAAGSTLRVAGRAQGELVVDKDRTGREVVRLGHVGALVDRKIRAPMRPIGRKVIELDGEALDGVVRAAARAWEESHAH